MQPSLSPFLSRSIKHVYVSPTNEQKFPKELGGGKQASGPLQNILILLLFSI